MRTRLFALVLISAAACGGSSGDDEVPDAQSSTDATTACTAEGPVGLTLTTDDGVNLIADLYSPGHVGGPAVILLHMVPRT